MNFQLTGAQVQIVGIEDASGNQAPAGTTPFVFSTSDSTIATVASTAPSGLQAQIATTGKPGVVTISATDGTHNVSAQLTVLFDESGLQIAPIGAAQPVPTTPAATATPTPTPTPAPAATPTPTPAN